MRATLQGVRLNRANIRMPMLRRVLSLRVSTTFAQ